VAFKKFRSEPKTSGLTFFAAMRLRLLLDDPGTIESIVEPSGAVTTSTGCGEPQPNCDSASQQRHSEIHRTKFTVSSR
jgi:hypothetical protein